MLGVKFQQRAEHENFAIREDSVVPVLRHYRDFEAAFDFLRSKLSQCSL